MKTPEIKPADVARVERMGEPRRPMLNKENLLKALEVLLAVKPEPCQMRLPFAREQRSGSHIADITEQFIGTGVIITDGKKPTDRQIK